MANAMRRKELEIRRDAFFFSVCVCVCVCLLVCVCVRERARASKSPRTHYNACVRARVCIN